MCMHKVTSILLQMPIVIYTQELSMYNVYTAQCELRNSGGHFVDRI